MPDSMDDAFSRAPEKGAGRIGECPVHCRVEALRLLAAANDPAEMWALADAVDAASADDWLGLRISLGTDGELYGAIWVQPVPGGSAVLWPPADSCERKFILLQEAGRWADYSGLYFTQIALTEPSNKRTHRDLKCAGFRNLAGMLTFSGSPDETGPSAYDGATQSEALGWEVLGAENYPRFAALFDAVNGETRDFPELARSRPTPAVYEGFLGRGGLREGLWRVLLWRGQDAGLLLLAPHREACSMELLFMGVRPVFRGIGLGRAITQKAFSVAREHGYQLILTADARNSRALTIYREAGLQVVCTSRLFVRFSSRLKDK